MVEYNGKQYYVGVDREQCKTLDVMLYYDKDRDEIFEKDGIPIRGIVVLFIIFLCSLTWLCIVIRRGWVLLFASLFISCKGDISYYEIPVIDKVLTINTPVFNDYAYVRIDTNKSSTLKKCADLKIVRNETTDVSLIFNKQKNDTIFYSDRWDDVTLLSKKHTYQKVRWYDDRFYVKDNKTNRYYIRNNFIEVVIKDNATFIVYQSNNSFRVLKPLSDLQQ